MPPETSDEGDDRIGRALRALGQEGISGLADLWHAMLAELSTKKHGAAASTTLAAPPDQGAGIVRTGDGVLVSSKKLVMEVYHDPAGNYSVCGYAERLRKSFGMIYLGLDKGPEYDAQSSSINAAIQTISERDSFDLALRETRNALAPLGNPADFDIQDVCDKVLAALCAVWFDLPDDITVRAGGFRPSNLLPPARCPGDYSAPSGYTFMPDPEFLLALFGQRLGQVLKEEVTKFVSQRRSPSSPPLKGMLSRAIFAAFPDTSDQDDIIASTIIGVMMGFLPTVEGNVIATVRAWQKDATFTALQQQLASGAEPDLYLRACSVLKVPLKQAMQLNPVPNAVWRTAVKEHTLGDTNPVQVRPGDKVSIGIASATREDLANKITDVFAVFGGDRREHPHPTHACPGYAMAMGVLLGIIAGVMDPGPGGAHSPLS
jgi:cytochrome P450